MQALFEVFATARRPSNLAVASVPTDQKATNSSDIRSNLSDTDAWSSALVSR